MLIHFVETSLSFTLCLDFRHIVHGVSDGLWIDMVFIVVKVGLLLVVKVESICVL